MERDSQQQIAAHPRRGLTALLIAQFMGAANDNILKTLLGFAVVRGMWAGKLGEGGQGLIALCLFVPFILFSGWAGPLADKHSKRSISVWMKLFEVPLALLAGLGFITGNFWVAAIAMLLLATQSTFFSPAKYGMIPEIVPKANVSRANGILNMTTNIAIITGMLVAGIVSDSIQGSGETTDTTIGIWLPGIVLTGVAILGLSAIVFLPKLIPMDSATHVPVNPLATYVSTLIEMCRTQLMKIAIAWACFYLLATIVLLLVTELGSVLDVDDTKLSYLLASIGISVGIGSLLAGFLSRGKIRIIMSKYAALGMAISMFEAGLAPVSYWSTLVCLILLGLFAGLYAVPLQSLMQMLPKSEHRGRVLATSNAISFLLMAIGSLLYWVARPLFGDNPYDIFIVCGVIAVVAWFITLTIRNHECH
jgi:acyl-[acyl-carrier-protein]-phospholipid O-acyltransferase/long-chain-fatty-acid--[acyl-carrier-protein] ligase